MGVRFRVSGLRSSSTVVRPPAPNRSAAEISATPTSQHSAPSGRTSRRAFLATVGGLAVGVLAACQAPAPRDADPAAPAAQADAGREAEHRRAEARCAPARRRATDRPARRLHLAGSDPRLGADRLGRLRMPVRLAPGRSGPLGAQPLLATSWELGADRLIVKLREGVKFHDGSDADGRRGGLEHRADGPEPQEPRSGSPVVGEPGPAGPGARSADGAGQPDPPECVDPQLAERRRHRTPPSSRRRRPTSRARRGWRSTPSGPGRSSSSRSCRATGWSWSGTRVSGGQARTASRSRTPTGRRTASSSDPADAARRDAERRGRLDRTRARG